MSFAEKLEYGKVAEGLIAQWLMARGNSILPVYEIEKSVNKGPQLFSTSVDHVAPDMVAFTANGVMWIEAKHKTVFTWHRNTQHWTTGIDLRHYGDYMHVAKKTKLPVWLMFFHRNEVPSDSDKRYGCPSKCPTGLFGGNLFNLILKEHHRTLPIDYEREGYLGHGKSGMVYWAHNDLKKLATKQEILDSARSKTIK